MYPVPRWHARSADRVRADRGKTGPVRRRRRAGAPGPPDPPYVVLRARTVGGWAGRECPATFRRGIQMSEHLLWPGLRSTSVPATKKECLLGVSSMPSLAIDG